LSGEDGSDLGDGRTLITQSECWHLNSLLARDASLSLRCMVTPIAL
jgi:hypothetical protein